MNSELKRHLPFLIILVAAIMLIKYCKGREIEDETVHISHNMVVQEIETLGRLEVVKYNIKDVIEYEKVRNWLLPNSKTALIVSGEVIGCIDLHKLKEEDIFIEKDSISIKLPAPEICSFKIDHSQSRVYNIENGWWETTQLIDEAYRHAEKHLYNQAEKMGLTQDSKVNTEKVLKPLLHKFGFNKIHIEFHENGNKKSYGIE